MPIVKKEDIKTLFDKVNAAKEVIQNSDYEYIKTPLNKESIKNVISGSDWDAVDFNLLEMGGNKATREEYDRYKNNQKITPNEEFQGYSKISWPAQPLGGNKILKYQNFLDLITTAELAQLRCYINCGGDCPGGDLCPDEGCTCDAEPIVCEWDCPADIYCDPDHGF